MYPPMALYFFKVCANVVSIWKSCTAIFACKSRDGFLGAIYGSSGSLYRMEVKSMYVYIVQWNLSNLDTLGTEESVLISEVS